MGDSGVSPAMRPSSSLGSRVYIINYRGTVYGVYARHEDARRAAEEQFGQDAEILARQVL